MDIRIKISVFLLIKRKFLFLAFLFYFFKLFEEETLIVCVVRKKKKMWMFIILRETQRLCVCVCSHGQFTSKRVEENAMILINFNKLTLEIEPNLLHHQLQHVQHRSKPVRRARKNQKKEILRHGIQHKFGWKVLQKKKQVENNGNKRMVGWRNMMLKYIFHFIYSIKYHNYLGKFETKKTYIRKCHPIFQYGQRRTIRTEIF